MNYPTIHPDKIHMKIGEQLKKNIQWPRFPHMWENRKNNNRIR